MELINLKKKIFSIFIIAILCVVLAISNSFALWNSDSVESVISNFLTNPVEKYLYYYVVVSDDENVNGFSYYELNDLPLELKNEILGVAVRYYDGYMKEIEIPSVVTMNIFDEEIDILVIQVLATSFIDRDIEKIILPETISYIEDGALSMISFVIEK